MLLLMFWWSPLAQTPEIGREIMSISTVLVVALLWLQPPHAIVLGESSRATGRILGVVSSCYLPLRVVALLDRQRTGSFVGSFSWLTDDLRTESDHDWLEVVESMEDVVSVIVLDARTESPVVIEEVKRILSSADRLKRTIFIISDEGEAPALRANGINCTDPGPEFKLVTEDEFLPQLRGVRISKK